MKWILTLVIVLITATVFPQPLPARIVVDLADGNVWDPYSRIHFTYNPDGTISEQLSEAATAGGWHAERTTEWSYHASGEILSNLSLFWNAAAGAWENSSRLQVTFDAAELPAEELYQEWYTNHWENLERYTFVNDAVTGYRVQEMFEEWSLADAEWTIYSRQDHTYDVSGNRIETLHFQWDENAQEWQLSMRSTFTYSASGKVLASLHEEYDNGQWSDQGRQTWTYDGNDQLTSHLREVRVGGSWRNSLLMTSSYNGDQSTDCVTYQNWDQSLESWENSHRYRHEYGELGLAEGGQEGIVVFPVPATDELNVSSGKTITSVLVTDLSGKECLSEIVSGPFLSVDVKALPAGVYLLHLLSDGKTVSRRFVKS